MIQQFFLVENEVANLVFCKQGRLNLNLITGCSRDIYFNILTFNYFRLLLLLLEYYPIFLSADNTDKILKIQEYPKNSRVYCKLQKFHLGTIDPCSGTFCLAWQKMPYLGSKDPAEFGTLACASFFQIPSGTFNISAILHKVKKLLRLTSLIFGPAQDQWICVNVYYL